MRVSTVEVGNNEIVPQIRLYSGVYTDVAMDLRRVNHRASLPQLRTPDYPARQIMGSIIQPHASGTSNETRARRRGRKLRQPLRPPPT